MQIVKCSLPEKTTKKTCWSSKTKFTNYYSKGYHHFEAILEVPLESVQDLLKATVQDPSFKNCSAPLMPTEPPTLRGLPNHNGEKNFTLGRAPKNPQHFLFWVHKTKFIWKKTSIGPISSCSCALQEPVTSEGFKGIQIGQNLPWNPYQNLENFPPSWLIFLSMGVWVWKRSPLQILNHQGTAHCQVCS